MFDLNKIEDRETMFSLYFSGLSQFADHIDKAELESKVNELLKNDSFWRVIAEHNAEKCNNDVDTCQTFCTRVLKELNLVPLYHPLGLSLDSISESLNNQ